MCSTQTKYILRIQNTPRICHSFGRRAADRKHAVMHICRYFDGNTYEHIWVFTCVHSLVNTGSTATNCSIPDSL